MTNKLNKPPFQPVRVFRAPTSWTGKDHRGRVLTFDAANAPTYQLHVVSREAGYMEYSISGLTPRELRNLINEIESVLPDPFKTCDFCGAEMDPGDNVNECGHIEGQGGAAGVLDVCACKPDEGDPDCPVHYAPPASSVGVCFVCGRSVAFLPGTAVLSPHVNGDTNRACAGASIGWTNEAPAPAIDTREIIHIQGDTLGTAGAGRTRCGLSWFINMIGNCNPRRVEEYRARENCRICPDCER